MNDGSETDLQPRVEEAAPIALELMKQLITLSSGILALSAAFLDKFRVPHAWEYSPLILSWVLLIISLIAALNVISAMVQSRLTPEREWHKGWPKTVGRISKVTFVSGVCSFGLFALLATWSNTSQPKEDTPKGVVIIDGQAARDRDQPVVDSPANVRSPTASSTRQGKPH